MVPLDQWNQLVDTQELIRKQFKTIYHSLDEVPAKHKKMKNGRLTFLRGGFVFTREESSSLFKRTINENQWISPIAAEFRKDNYYFILGFWIKINDYVSVS